MKKHAKALYPQHWPYNIAESSKIRISNADFGKLKDCFEKSIEKTVSIIKIEEICNQFFFDRFERNVI